MTYNTVNTKAEQLTNGYFKAGTGETIVLIIGSCRSVPYIGYFNKLNELNNNLYTIFFIDPFNFGYNKNDERIDMEANIVSLETDERILSLLKSTSIIVHEYYSNYGMFSFDKTKEKNIYQFGLNPEIDICIPNFNDNFILFKDIITFDVDIRKRAQQDWNVIDKLSEQIQSEMYELSRKGLQKFYDVCMLSDIPEMKIIFGDNFKKKRFFHSYNHVAKPFTMAIFNILCNRYLKTELPENFYEDQEDIFANSFTPLTEYDVKFWRYSWDEEIKPIL